MSIQTGQILEAISQSPITQEQLRRYAEASGDPNPIHLDEAVAKKVGLPGVIAHGMLIAGLLAERAQQFARNEGKGEWKLAQFQTRFKAMTFLGDVIAMGGTVKSASETEIVLDLQATNQRGETPTTGVARLVRK